MKWYFKALLILAIVTALFAFMIVVNNHATISQEQFNCIWNQESYC